MKEVQALGCAFTCKLKKSKIIWQQTGATYSTVQDQSGEDEVCPSPIKILQQHGGERREGEGSEPRTTHGDARS